MTAMATVRPRGACGSVAAPRRAGGRTRAATFPTSMAPPKASTSHCMRSEPPSTRRLYGPLHGMAYGPARGWRRPASDPAGDHVLWQLASNSLKVGRPCDRWSGDRGVGSGLTLQPTEDCGANGASTLPAGSHPAVAFDGDQITSRGNSWFQTGAALLEGRGIGSVARRTERKRRSTTQTPDGAKTTRPSARNRSAALGNAFTPSEPHPFSNRPGHVGELREMVEEGKAAGTDRARAVLGHDHLRRSAVR